MTIGPFSNFSFNAVDPNSYAQEYANKNGMTLEEAKAELKAKNGDPKKPEERNDVDIPIFNNYFNADNSTISGNSDILSMTGDFEDPDSYAQVYADENGISLEEAKSELRELRGEPQAPNANSGAENNGNLSMTGDLGDPDSYAQIYADENGISLEEAKNELRELRGEPQAPTMNRGATNNENSISDLLARILDFLRGGNGPQQEGDPEYYKNIEEM